MTLLFQLTRKKKLVVYRYPAGEYVNKRWVKGTPTEVLIEANIQPLKWHEVQQMPESDRTNKWCKLFTKSCIRTKKEGENPHDADRFYWQGDLYEIRKVQDWNMGVLDHYSGMAVRVELTPEETTL